VCRTEHGWRCSVPRFDSSKVVCHWVRSFRTLRPARLSGNCCAPIKNMLLTGGLSQNVVRRVRGFEVSDGRLRVGHAMHPGKVRCGGIHVEEPFARRPRPSPCSDGKEADFDEERTGRRGPAAGVFKGRWEVSCVATLGGQVCGNAASVLLDGRPGICQTAVRCHARNGVMI
jgi:hypothetical protein